MTPRIQKRRLFRSVALVTLAMAFIGARIWAQSAYSRSILRAKESVLKSDLFTLRTSIDDYTRDKHQRPETLQDLVTAGYFRQIPVDPMTASAKTWKPLIVESTVSDQPGPGICDVRSGSDKLSPEGTRYSEW